jgi:ABC-type Fe3+-hydroxamate transport system substrate-binding protein
MRIIVFSIAIIAAMFSACSDNNTTAKEETKTNDTATVNPQASNPTSQQTASLDEAVTAYLHLKNALTSDNGKEAAEAGKHLHEELLKLDNAPFAVDQKKVYDDVKDDIKEHAEHISANPEKIGHQREHFDMLSKDMYDLVKTVKPSQTLYKDHCPMFNDKKGAIWLSEVKDIQNPYYGKKMLTCGEQQEEIK